MDKFGDAVSESKAGTYLAMIIQRYQELARICLAGGCLDLVGNFTVVMINAAMGLGHGIKTDNAFARSSVGELLQNPIAFSL